MPATEEYWRNLPQMHRIFAVSSVALLACVLWMMAADHDDEWRYYQKQFQAKVADKLKAQEARKKTPELAAQIAATEKSVDAAKTQLRQKSAEVSRLQSVVDTAQGQFAIADREVKFARAERDVARANYDIAVRDAAPQSQLDALKAIFDKSESSVRSLEIKYQNASATLAEANEALKKKTQIRDDAEADLKKLTADIDRDHKALVKLAPESSIAAFKRWTMELPIIDGFNSHLKIQQDWLPDLLINYGGMKNVARFDRCRTCHQGIDQVESGGVPAFPHGEKYPQPYSTHPRPELYLTSTSPHPTQKFGCSICHDGQGSATSFTNASHTPNNPHIAHEWEEEYGWFNNHFWEYPMHPDRFMESGCLKCHHNVVELGVNKKFGASAPKVYEGYNIIREYGCFGCHEINGYDGTRSIGPDMRLEPSLEEMAKMSSDPDARPGTMRKVGPALRHLASKTTAGWTEYWTTEPKRFRPTTRMPQFFDLEGQRDEHAARLTPVEIAALTHYLFDKSQSLDLLSPDKDYEANAERGKLLFSQRGCLACHSHEDFPESKQTFGPELSRVHEKIQPGEKGRDWLYTWVRDPERHHPRTKMPNLFLETYTENGQSIDPAADIAAWLLSKGPKEFEPLPKDSQGLHELVALYLSKSLTKAKVDEFMAEGWFPQTNKAEIKGDEVELYTGKPGEGEPVTDAQLMNYVGRRTISRYGCYGCHDIPGFEAARPIGTALQDWGRKDKSKLAFEHIAEFLHHHGEPDGSSTKKHVDQLMKKASAGEFSSEEEEQAALGDAYFYEQVVHGDRAGFLWQKLRSPRSYDYMKIETKGYDERLRMPKFPFDEHQIEAVATFVLGLVADPPAEKYQYRPQGPAKDVVEGEKLLVKYNCISCHIVELPEIKYGVDPETISPSELTPADYEEAAKLLLLLKPPRQGLTHEKFVTAEKAELPVVSFQGLLYADADPESDPADREYAYDLWETLKVGDKILFPGSRMLVPELNRVSVKPARGGPFAERLVDSLMKANPDTNRFLAWQASPPPLYLEGIKVQTPWLYKFLKNPGKIRHTTVLRMPQFNMSDKEAQSLANYFAAADGAEYPYQDIPQREPPYLSVKEQAHPNYLDDTWKMLNAPLCIKCHSVGGREYKASDPKKDIRGPNLSDVSQRLQPEWVLLWLYKPSWITPYTSMPQNLPKNQKNFENLFGGDGSQQTISLRDALMNYPRLLEKEGKYVDATPAATPETPAAGGENQ